MKESLYCHSLRLCKPSADNDDQRHLVVGQQALGWTAVVQSPDSEGISLLASVFRPALRSIQVSPQSED
jgi:hypothetical protein